MPVSPFDSHVAKNDTSEFLSWAKECPHGDLKHLNDQTSESGK